MMLTIALPTGSVIYLLVGIWLLSKMNVANRMRVVICISVIVPLPPAIMKLIMGTDSSQIWAHVPSIIVTPFLRLHSWSVFIDTMIELARDNKKVALKTYGDGCLLVGLFAFGIYPLNLAVNGYYFPMQLTLSCTILLCFAIAYHVKKKLD